MAGHPAPAPRSTTQLRRPARVDHRAALAGIVYQLRTGAPWRLLPTRQLGCGSPVTCWRRLRDWQRAGVWRRLHQVLLDQLGRDGQLDWSRASVDSLSTPRIARRGIDPSQRLGRHRYVVERSLAWLVGYRRLQVRYERRADILLGFLHLACAPICLHSRNRRRYVPTSSGVPRGSCWPVDGVQPPRK